MIECLPYSGMGDDEEPIYWINKSDFYSSFTPDDYNILRRPVRSVYSSDWFRFDKGACPQFHASACSIVNGETEFFSGRHRIDVLFRYLDRIPIAIKPAIQVELMRVPATELEKNISRFDSIKKQAYRPGETFLVPNLLVYRGSQTELDLEGICFSLSVLRSDHLARRKMGYKEPVKVALFDPAV